MKSHPSYLTRIQIKKVGIKNEKHDKIIDNAGCYVMP